MEHGVKAVPQKPATGHNGPVTIERWTPERRRELTRTALLEAAAQVFSRRGFYGASLDEIAETAGFTRGAIYKNFADKEGLFLATIERRDQQTLAAFSEWFDERIEHGDAPPNQDTAALAQAFQQIMGRNQDWYALDLEARLYALRNPAFRERYVANYRQISDSVVRFLEDLNAVGFRTKLPPDRLARIVEVASEGFVAWAFLDPDDGRLFESFFDVLLEAVFDDGAG